MDKYLYVIIQKKRIKNQSRSSKPKLMKNSKTITSTGSGSTNENSKNVIEKASTPQHPSAPASSNASNDRALVFKTATINVLFHLLGIVFGFILFYISFRTECAHRITQLMNDTKITTQLVQQQRDEQASIVSEYNNKLQQQSAQQLAIETNYQERMGEMKIREKSLLDEQSELTLKHLECIQSKTTLYDQLQSYQQNELNERLQLHNITSECEALRNKILQQEETIKLLQSNSEHQHAKLFNRLNLTKVMLHEKIEEVEQLKTVIGNDTTTATAACQSHNHHKLTKEMTQLQADIKRQQYASMVNMYGKSPLMSYYVIMIVQSVDPNNQNGVGPAVTLEIELNAVYDMPHTTYTFLSMIENQLFHDTSLSAVHQQSKNVKSNKKQSMYNDIVLTGGHVNTVRTMKQASKLKRSYGEFGYNIQQLLLFTERNTKYKCTAEMHTIGFVEYGPVIEIYYRSNDKDNSSDHKSSTKHTCFGQIISGIDSLLLLENQTGDDTKKMRLRIIDTRIVKKDHIIKSSNHPEL